MQRINLGAPYDEFIKNLINSGYYSTATEVIRDALRDKMKEMEVSRIARISELISEGQISKDAGRTVKLTENYLYEKLKLARDFDKEIPEHIKP